jgi:hypothetical protein
MTDQPLDLDEYEAAARNAARIGSGIDPGAITALAAEIRRLRARVTELEGPAVEARAALAALCYDLEDPGTAALGALYLISRATTGIETPRDDAAAALAKHASDVLYEVADQADPEPPEASFFGDYGPQVADWLRRRADYKTRTPAVHAAARP